MNKAKEIHGFLYTQKLSRNQISKALGISRTVVQKYAKRFEQLRLTDNQISDISSQELEKLMFPKASSAQFGKTKKGKDLPDYEKVANELKNKDVTLLVLWEEYKAESKNPFAYSRFCDHFLKYRKLNNLQMKQDYQWGDCMQVDYSGSRPFYIDPKSQNRVYCEFFVLCFCASNYTYCEAQRDQKLDSWCQGHVNAFNFFGCVGKKIIPDNLKSAVTKAHRYDPDKNPTYTNLCHYYELAVLPARKKSPRDKGKAENAVLVCQQWILARLRNVTVYSIEELNIKIKELLIEFNGKPMQGYGKQSRNQLFETHEKPASKGLPLKPWEKKQFKYCKVAMDYCVTIDFHHYSVPFQYVSCKVLVIVCDKMIEIYLDTQRIAVHKRKFKKGGYSIEESHRPEKHKQVLSWTPERIQRWANKIGPNTAKYIKALMESKRFPEEGFRPALGAIRRLSDRDPKEAELASSYALNAKQFRNKQLDRILNSPWIKFQLGKQDSSSIVIHDNLHGMHNYKEGEA